MLRRMNALRTSRRLSRRLRWEVSSRSFPPKATRPLVAFVIEGLPMW